MKDSTDGVDALVLALVDLYFVRFNPDDSRSHTCECHPCLITY